jgi:hypothetical protein
VVNKIVKKSVITAQKHCYRETDKVFTQLADMHGGDVPAGVISHGMLSVSFVMMMCIGRSCDLPKEDFLAYISTSKMSVGAFLKGKFLSRKSLMAYVINSKIKWNKIY